MKHTEIHRAEAAVPDVPAHSRPALLDSPLVPEIGATLPSQHKANERAALWLQSPSSQHSSR